jgi:hypothetical protein
MTHESICLLQEIYEEAEDMGCLRTPNQEVVKLTINMTDELNLKDWGEDYPQDFEGLPLPKLIVKSYTADQQGQDIKDKDVVRPLNHRWCIAGGEETHNWKVKSAARCPTYGSFRVCMRCGPAGKRCKGCLSERSGIYTILMYRGNILDSITIAGICETGHETARADHTYKWLGDSLKSVNMEVIGIIVKRIYY